MIAVERLDAPIERIEIRLMDDNATQPVVIDIQKAVSTTIGPPSLSNAEDRSNSESDSHHIVEQRLEKKFETEDRKKSQLASTFELKVEHKIEHIVPHVEARRWDSGQIETVDPSNSRQEYIDDLPPLDIVDDVVSNSK